MRQPLIAGNWKMNKLWPDGIQLAGVISDKLQQGLDTRTGVTPLVILAPPFHLLHGVAERISGVSGLALAAQNAAEHLSGAFTGEVSAPMIASTGAQWVILGHSERRSLFGETDDMLGRKAKTALDAGLNIIFCVGEVLQERMDEQHFDIVAKQLQQGLFSTGALDPGRVVVAYEPVWAIGTGQTATPDQAQEMHHHIRSLITTHSGGEVAQQTRILYGGSCKPDNAAELFSRPDVDGGLIGGASLDANQFLEIIRSA
jgi:triosephosphate isomerase